jgi:hypothetical protein
MLNGESLAALSSAAREHFATVSCFAAFEESVLAQTPAPFEFIQHSRERILRGKPKDKDTCLRKGLFLSGTEYWFFVAI